MVKLRVLDSGFRNLPPQPLQRERRRRGGTRFGGSKAASARHAQPPPPPNVPANNGLTIGCGWLDGSVLYQHLGPTGAASCSSAA